MNSSRNVALTLLGLLVAMPSYAAWSPGGVFVCEASGPYGITHSIIMDLPSGDLAIYGIGRSPSNNNFCLQHITPGGDRSPGWPELGVLESSVLGGTQI